MQNTSVRLVFMKMPSFRPLNGISKQLTKALPIFKKLSTMKTLVQSFISVIFFFCLFASCKKDGEDIPGEVEFYLLDSYETLNETAEIDPGSVILAGDPLLVYSDLKSYSADEYFFIVTDEARETIEGMEHSVNGIAFAVTANEEVVYTAYFVPSYSSASVQWIVIDPVFWHFTNRMHVKLGYPGQFEGSVIPDLRNDERILKIFRRDRNLVE